MREVEQQWRARYAACGGMASGVGIVQAIRKFGILAQGHCPKLRNEHNANLNHIFSVTKAREHFKGLK